MERRMICAIDMASYLRVDIDHDLGKLIKIPPINIDGRIIFLERVLVKSVIHNIQDW